MAIDNNDLVGEQFNYDPLNNSAVHNNNNNNTASSGLPP